MAGLVLNANERKEMGSRENKRLRKSANVPGVVYGSGHENMYLKFSKKELLGVFKGHSPENLILELKIKRTDNSDEAKNVLIKDIQRNAITDEYVHIDFMEISMTEKIRVRVPVETIGDPVGVTEQGGIVEHLLRDFEIECLPKDIPEFVEVNIAALKIGDTLFLKDVALPAGVELISDKELGLIAVVAPKAEEEAVPAEGEAAKEPEVVSKGKEVKEGEEPKEEKEKEKKKEEKK